MLLYPPNTLDKLEFSKIKELLWKQCKSSLGQKQVDEMPFMQEVSDIKLALGKVSEFIRTEQSGHHFPLENLHDLTKELQLLQIQEAVLDKEAYFKIKQCCFTIDRIFRFFKNNAVLYPGLFSIVQNSYYEKEIVLLIDKVFDENGQIKDNASKELFTIRTNLSQKRNELNRVFNKIIQKLAKDGVLTDIGQSIRNGRKVVSVVSESKRQIGGIIHDQSDSGKTTFIEPKETVELNNTIFELERAEEREIYLILRALTAQVSTYHSLLHFYQFALAEYDFIFAKSSLSKLMKACAPIVSNKVGFHLINARHPLLFLFNDRNKKPTIPLTLKLDDEHRILVISGPNAGGKTVCMKTVGLLQLMLQAGLHIPAEERSEMGIMRSVLVDIGDSQSIEYELSTYSSHLKTMKFFLENADGKTLFFIDELGTGSDPALGGAFAEAILEELNFKRAYGIVTTHYLNLKIMANNTRGVLNAAMIFDEEKLLPTYQLSIGKPGSSYTFAIAERTGMKRLLIERAKDLVDAQHVQLDHLLNRVEQEHKLLLEKEKELKLKTEELAGLRKDFDVQFSKLNKQKEQQAQKSNQPQSSTSSHFLREAEKKLAKLLRDWEINKNLESVAAQTKKILPETPKPAKAEVLEKPVIIPVLKIEEVKIGMGVKVLSLHKNGEVEQIKGSKITVITDSIRIQVDVKDLQKIG